MLTKTRGPCSEFMYSKENIGREEVQTLSVNVMKAVDFPDHIVGTNFNLPLIL